MKVIFQAEVPPLGKMDLFKGSIGKKWKQNKSKKICFLLIKKKQQSRILILKSCFTECVIFERLWGDPQILCLCFNFQFCVLFVVAIKNSPKTWGRQITAAQINNIIVIVYVACLVQKIWRGSIFHRNLSGWFLRGPALKLAKRLISTEASEGPICPTPSLSEVPVEQRCPRYHKWADYWSPLVGDGVNIG